MARLKLGIDMDGVVADFTSAFRKEAEELLGRKFPSFSVDWEFSNWGFKKGEQDRVWEKIKETEDWFYLYLMALPGASADLPFLAAQHELYFVTTRIQTAGLPIQRQTQLHLYELGIDFPTVIVTKDKGPIVNDLQLDVFIDDKPENLSRIAECSPKTKLFLMNQSWNQKVIDDQWTRLDNLDGFVAAVETLSGE